jgi:hypothetical protein
MLLQAGGQANALLALIKSEQDRGPDFLRLANALSALYWQRGKAPARCNAFGGARMRMVEDSMQI